MRAGQVIEITSEWVEDHGSQMSGFRGAYLLGGLSTTEEDRDFPSHTDVDLRMVLEGQGPDHKPNLCITYQGVFLDVSFGRFEDHHSPGTILSGPGRAHHMAVGRILSDPTGLLGRTHRSVKAEYPRRKWVLARCDSCKQSAEEILAGMGEDATSYLYLVHALSGLMTSACLRPPTIRRCLVVMREGLEAQGRLDLHEEMLALLGCAQMGRAEVESHLPECVEFFDRAVAVKRSRVRHSAFTHSHLRPYLLEGTREMLEAEDHREAMFWILAYCMFSNLAIQADAPEEEKRAFEAKHDRLWGDLGWGTPEARRARAQQATKT